MCESTDASGGASAIRETVGGRRVADECAVCLDRCVNGVRLECRHVFCYLCVKGSAQQSSNRCPVCRHPISGNYLDSPDLIGDVDWRDHNESDDDLYDDMCWQYEGRNGWWLYDWRTSKDIQTAFKADQPSVDVLIAGFVYVIDLKRMIQYRRHDPNRIRRIRRHPLDPITTKGVAGLRKQFPDIQPHTHSSLNDDSPNDGQTSATGVHSKEDEEVVVIDSNEDNCETQTTHREPVVDIEDEEEVASLERNFNTSVSLRDNVKETYL